MGYFLEGLRQALSSSSRPAGSCSKSSAYRFWCPGRPRLWPRFLPRRWVCFLALVEFRGRRFLIGLLQTAMAVPAVLIGLVVYILVSRRGLLGFLGLLFTPGAMILAQALLAFPLIVALTLAALKDKARDGRDLAYALGASRGRMLLTILRQGRFAFLAAMVAGFSRVLGETGMTLMVGGNIKGATRVMTTAISLETMKGNFEIGLALGLVLLVVALLVNVVLQWGQGK